ARIAFLRQAAPEEAADLPDLSEAALARRAEDWLPMAAGDPPLRSLGAVSPQALHDAIGALVPWESRRRFDALVPETFAVPGGRPVPIDFRDGVAGFAARAQALFGMDGHPAILRGRVPLAVTLLSPAGRPIQTTTDLPGFWRGGWAEVRREMRGRYPRHDWPQDPATAAPRRRGEIRPQSQRRSGRPQLG
ncbi:MAG: ATP-dependent helicase HrpB, partial [Leptolyngbya sp. SIO4C5]|nr:ATP-dependent helicase HrpB [Leptolyngbya sp. SIO4C5]